MFCEVNGNVHNARQWPNFLRGQRQYQLGQSNNGTRIHLALLHTWVTIMFVISKSFIRPYLQTDSFHVFLQDYGER